MENKSEPNKKEFATLIPLRGGSKGIPRKNLILIKGKPLFWYVTDASIEAGVKTFISTEDQEIKGIANNMFSTINVIDRPLVLSQDTSSTEDVIEHFLDTIKFPKHIILLQATSPLTRAINLEEAITEYLSNNCKPLVSVVHEHSFFWDKEGHAINYDPLDRPRRQDWGGVYKENGAIYIFSREHFKEFRCRAAEKCILYKMHNNTTFEIDELEDLKIITKLIEDGENTKE